jgi:hypothetical protein
MSGYDFNEFLLKTDDTTTSQDGLVDVDDLSSMSETISTIDSRLAELQEKRQLRKDQSENHSPPAIDLSASPWLKSSKPDILEPEVEETDKSSVEPDSVVEIDHYSRDDFDENSEDDKQAFYENLDREGNFKHLAQALDEDSIMEDYNVAILQNKKSESNSILSDFDEKTEPISERVCLISNSRTR